jgi:hypothetical protein
MTRRDTLGATRKAPIDCAYVHGRSSIEITADLQDGWTKRTKTFGYSEKLPLDFVGDYSIRIHVTVLPRPSGFGEEGRVFPAGAEGNGGDHGIRYTLRQSLLTVLVQLLDADDRMNRGLPWRMTSNHKLAIHWVEDAIARLGRTHFELQLLIVFNPPPHARPEDVRDWERRFFPGGLPSLGKRQ